MSLPNGLVALAFRLAKEDETPHTKFARRLIELRGNGAPRLPDVDKALEEYAAALGVSTSAPAAEAPDGE